MSNQYNFACPNTHTIINAVFRLNGRDVIPELKEHVLNCDKCFTYNFGNHLTEQELQTSRQLTEQQYEHLLFCTMCEEKLQNRA